MDIKFESNIPDKHVIYSPSMDPNYIQLRDPMNGYKNLILGSLLEPRIPECPDESTDDGLIEFRRNEVWAGC